MEKRLGLIFKSRHRLILHALKMVLGEEFLCSYHRYRVNTDVVAMFLASVLEVGESKDMARQLCKKLIKGKLQGGLDDTLANYEVGRGIPLPGDYYVICW